MRFFLEHWFYTSGLCVSFKPVCTLAVRCLGGNSWLILVSSRHLVFGNETKIWLVLTERVHKVKQDNLLINVLFLTRRPVSHFVHFVHNLTPYKFVFSSQRPTHNLILGSPSRERVQTNYKEESTPAIPTQDCVWMMWLWILVLSGRSASHQFYVDHKQISVFL